MTGDHFMATLCRSDVFLLFTFLEYYLELALTDNPKRALKNMLNDGLKHASHLILDRPNLTGHYILHNIIVRQKQGQDIQKVWLRTEDKISLIYKKRENYK